MRTIIKGLLLPPIVRPPKPSYASREAKLLAMAIRPFVISTILQAL